MLRILSSLVLLGAALSSSASFSFVVGQDTDSGLPLLTQTADLGSTWSNQILPSNITSGAMLGGACNSNVCVAVGQDLSSDNPALFLQTIDDGARWDYVSIAGVDKNVPFYNAACSNSICVALGKDEGKPYLVQTVDAGATWSVVNLNINGKKAILFDVSCQDNLCVAVGVMGKSHLLLQTNDAGVTWERKHLHVLSDESMLTSVDCNADKCIIGGAREEGRKHKLRPALYQLDISKNAWEPVPVVGNLHRNEGFYGDVSCGPTICAATGYNDIKKAHFVAMTDDAGEVWTSRNFVEDSVNIDSSHIRLHCTDSQCYILWSTVGAATPSSLLITGKQGQFQALDIPYEATYGKLYDINCGDGLCYVTGSANDGSALLLQSLDAGPWSRVTLDNSSVKGDYYTGASTK